MSLIQSDSNKADTHSRQNCTTSDPTMPNHGLIVREHVIMSPVQCNHYCIGHWLCTIYVDPGYENIDFLKTQSPYTSIREHWFNSWISCIQMVKSYHFHNTVFLNFFLKGHWTQLLLLVDNFLMLAIHLLINWLSLMEPHLYACLTMHEGIYCGAVVGWDGCWSLRLALAVVILDCSLVGWD